MLACERVCVCVCVCVMWLGRKRKKRREEKEECSVFEYHAKNWFPQWSVHASNPHPPSAST